MNAGFTADDPFRNGRAEGKAAESHAGNLSKTWGGDTVSSGTPLFHSYGLDWMGYSLWNGRGPCCPTENSKNSRSVSGRRVLLLRPIQHTGLYGLRAVCKKGRLVPLAQERPFLIFYLGGMYEWVLFQIWIMSFKTARLPFPTPLRKMMPLSRPPAMPRSASRASPGPFTTQPMTATLMGAFSVRRRRSTS